MDPITGENLNASVTFDANMLAYILGEHQYFSTPIATAITRANDILLRNPERTETDDFYLWATPEERAKAELSKRLGKAGFERMECEDAMGLAQNASFAYSALVAGGFGVNKDEYAKQYISDVICHEVGHSLGLRHNFVGSTNLSTAQLSDDQLTSKDGISASVMDYTPTNIVAVLKGHGNFFQPTVGPYDLWAIKYGYTDVKADSTLGERSALSAIAADSSKPGHAYMTDENADTWNPYAVRFDCAKDPVNFSAKMLEAAKRLRTYAITNLPHKDESYAKRTALIITSLGQTFKQGRLSARFVGGIVTNRDFKEDKSPQTLAPVDASVQRQAVQLIVKNCFSADSFKLPSDVLLTLTRDMNDDASSSWNAPLRDMISLQQNMLYSQLMSFSTTDRIIENQFKLGKNPNAYTIEEHYNTLLGAVFSEIGENENIAPTRRDLQRFALNGLMVQAGAPSGLIDEDVRMLASQNLKKLDARIGNQLAHSSKLDSMTRLHLKDSKDTVDRFLDRQYSK